MNTFYKEIKLFLASRWRVVLFLILPPLITVYYCLVFQDGVIEHTRLVIVDQDQTSLSRNLVSQFRDNKGFHVVAYADNVNTAFSLINQEKADMVLAVPSGFGSDIKAGKSPELLIAANAANMAISSNGMKRAGEIILTFNGGIEIKKLEGLGYTSREAEKIVQPLVFQYRQVGNPSGTFYDFLVWGLIGAVGHFPIMLFSATAFNRKKEMVTPGIFVPRFCVYTLFGVGQLLISILIGIVFFPMTFSGGILSLVLLVSIFTMAVTGLGMLLSLIIPDRAIVVQAATIVALPALILSGYTWPMSGFPGFVRVLGHLEPLTYFVNPLRRLALTGLVDDVYRFNCAILLIMFLLFFGAAFLVLGKGKVVHRWKKENLACTKPLAPAKALVALRSNKKKLYFPIDQEKFFPLVLREFKAIIKNNILMFNAFFLIILILFIGFVYQKGVLDRMDMVIADLDQTSTSRQVVRYFADNEKFQVSYLDSYPAVMDALEKGRALAGVVIPPGLSETVKNKKGAEVLLLIDGTNYIAANSAFAKANEILYSINAGITIKMLEGSGILPATAANIAQVIQMKQKVLYNPGYNYAYYLDYGLFGAGIFSLAMSAYALSLFRDHRKNFLSLRAMVARSMVFCLLISLMINLLFVFGGTVFHLPMAGSYLTFFILALGYGLLITVFGVILFLMAREEEGIFQLSVFFATTVFFTTGYTWPLQSIPTLLKPIYYLNPLTPFLNGSRACLVMAADWGVMGKYILWQLALTGLYFFINFLIYKKSHNPEMKK